MGRKAESIATNNLRAWREHRQMTQEELAEKIDTAANVIHQLETGKTRLSDKWLMRLAPALGTTPGFLLDHSPDDMDASFLEAALSVHPADRPQALQILRTFRKTGTNDK